MKKIIITIFLMFLLLTSLGCKSTKNENEFSDEVAEFVSMWDMMMPKKINDFVVAESISYNDVANEIVFIYTIEEDMPIVPKWGTLENFTKTLEKNYIIAAKNDPYQKEFIKNGLTIQYNFVWKNSGTLLKQITLNRQNVLD